MHPAALARSREIAKAVTDNLGGQALFGVELFVKGEQVWFSEVSPRPHDTGMVTMITQWQNEFELHARAILGLPVNTALKSAGASAVNYGGVEATGRCVLCTHISVVIWHAHSAFRGEWPICC